LDRSDWGLCLDVTHWLVGLSVVEQVDADVGGRREEVSKLVKRQLVDCGRLVVALYHIDVLASFVERVQSNDRRAGPSSGHEFAEFGEGDAAHSVVVLGNVQIHFHLLVSDVKDFELARTIANNEDEAVWVELNACDRSE